MRKSLLAVALAAALTTVAAPAAQASHARGHGGPSSPVVGYIQIQYITALGQTQPSYTLYGALSNPLLWTCADNIALWPAQPYKVTCVPASTAVSLVWHCDVLHADIQGLSATARGRTSLDCDGVGAPEAQTALIFGPLYDWLWAASTMTVTQFSCMVDGGTLPAAPDYRAGCGDPGIVRFHEHGDA